MKKTPNSAASAADTTITGLQTNWLDLAFGVDAPPVFGWRMESSRRGAAQKSYRIVVSKSETLRSPVWDSGNVASPLSAAVRYEGRPLEAATRYWWAVAVTDERGATTRSALSRFETGLLDETLWQGSKWIMAKPPASPEKNPHPAQALRKILRNPRPVRSAKWFVSGLGVFEAYVNGERVSNLGLDGKPLFDELKPGFTDARKLRQYFSYDVTHLFHTGARAQNVLAAVVTKGWWSDQITGKIGKNDAFRGQLVVTYADGSKDAFGTDSTWDAAFDGAVVSGEIHDGEIHDARIDMSWLTGGALGKAWGKAVVNNEFKGRIETLVGPPVRVRDDLELSPAWIRVLDAEHFDDVAEDRFGVARVLREYKDGDAVALAPGEILLADFGQNCVGWESLAFSGRKGAKLLVRHSEMLNDGRGLKSRGNDGPEGTPYYRNLRAACASSRYTLAGGKEETYHPSFTFYGYRYLAVTATAPVTFTRIRAEVVNSVPKGADTGAIETSDPLVNRLAQNCRWGHYGNYLSVPTDCPQRNERLGWTADTQVFSAAAAYDGVSYGFLSKFMRDMRDAQGPEGAFPGVAPFAQYGNERLRIGWSDAAVVVPYNMWKAYGDTTIIRENFDALVRYMNLLWVTKGPIPGWGDWLAYERNDKDIQRYLCAAYYVWNYRMMSEMAAAIGETERAESYAAGVDHAMGIFRWDYFNKDGTIQERYRCQTAALFALMLDANPDEASRQATLQYLLDNIHAHGDRLQTGFLGTAILMDTLSRAGATDVAYKLLLQRNEPSWLYSVLQGATTMWERWNSYTKEKGFGDAGMNSFNHYAYGAVLEWMFGTMAGIRYDPAAPGYRHFLLAPEPDRSVREVKATYRSPYGTIASAWRYDARGKGWTLDAAIPANSTAEVRIPVPKGLRLTVNGKAPEEATRRADGLAFRGMEGGVAVFDAVACAFTARLEKAPQKEPKQP